MVNKRTLKTLEYYKIIERLEGHAATSAGKKLVRELLPQTEAILVREALAITTEAVLYLREADRAPLGGIFDIRDGVKRAELQGVLSSREILEIGSTLRAARLMREFLLNEKLRELVTILPDWGGRLVAFPQMEREIERCISDEGEILDSASSKLQALRSQSKVLQNRVRDKLDSLIHSSETSKYLQDLLVTMRNQRYVIPVKQEYRGLFPGIVHDQSTSGATLFIEPMAVVELNNQLQLIESEEQEEQRRILAELSGKIGAIGGALQTTIAILARLDLAFAKAKYSLEIQGIEPELDLSGSLELKQARHPLLSGSVVPITVSLGSDFDTLVITGPNTGGKTVTLKTVGLLTLMAQTGLHIPALSGSRIALFKQIFCDIGDEQSIEQSLSTFSSHMIQIISIMEQAVNADCLVLLDELGAGTDPSEGAALAMSILTRLHQLGVRTVATTHYSELKAFAYKTEGIQNASVEFDINSLRPTYHLIIGLPGSSQAFEIATKLGLPEFIVDQAKQYISSEMAQVEEMLREIENDRRKAREDRRVTEEARAKGESFRQRYETELAKLKAEKADLLRQAKAEAREILIEVRRESENLLRRLKEAPDDEVNEIANEARKSLTDQLHQLEDKPVKPKRNQSRSAEKIKVGNMVRVLSVNQSGTVLEANKDQALVQVGIIKLSLPWDDLELLPAQEIVKPKKQLKQTGATGLEVAQQISAEISLRGLTVDEALYQLEKYLDQAILAGLKRFRVIHGKGTGALRQAVQQYLRNNPVVSRIYYAEQNEGGIGATIVEL